MAQETEFRLTVDGYWASRAPKTKDALLEWISDIIHCLQFSRDELASLRARALIQLREELAKHPFEDVSMPASVAEGILYTPEPPGFEEWMETKARYDECEFRAAYTFCCDEGAQFTYKELIVFRKLHAADRAFLMELVRESNTWADVCECRAPFYQPTGGTHGEAVCTKCFRHVKRSHLFVPEDSSRVIRVWYGSGTRYIEEKLALLREWFPAYREGLVPDLARCVCGNPRRDVTNTGFTCYVAGKCSRVADCRWVEEKRDDMVDAVLNKTITVKDDTIFGYLM